MSFATIVVTYNRKELLAENIKAQLMQKSIPNIIYIIDNHGNDNTEHYLKKQGLFHDPVKYIYLNENIGGAGGFEYGLRLAYTNGYDYYCLMDDDGKPVDDNTFSFLLNYTKKCENKLLMLNALVICNRDRLSFSLNGTKNVQDIIKSSENNFFPDDISPFNGTLISSELIKKIGFPRGDFFIKGDEAEYTQRANNNHATIGTVVNALYQHPSQEMKEIKIMGKIIFFGQIETPWKEYYRSRNYTYMFINNGWRGKAVLLYIMRLLFAMNSNCIDSKRLTLKMINMGYHDGKNKKMGKTVSP